MSQFSPHVSPALNLKNHISSAICEVIRLLENLRFSDDNGNRLDYSLYKLEQVVYLCVCSQNIWPNFLTDEVIQLLLNAYNNLSQDNCETDSRTPTNCEAIYTGSAGRLAFDIPRETLKLYLSYGFSLQKIANMFGTSRKTISRRVKSYSLREEVPKYDDISDEALDSAVSAVLHNFPNCGIRRMKGFLLGQVQDFGLPSRVRGDQGTENIEVARHMISHPRRGPDTGLLDINSATNLFCLQYVFTQRINQHFKMFQNGYDNHPLASESNMTPAQLWLYGLANYQGEWEPLEEDLPSFGVDYKGPLPSNEFDGGTWNDLSVQVPEIQCPLRSAAFNRMTCMVDPLEESSCYGIDIYIKSLEIVDDLSTLA
ncbi:hypothetical protein ACROYT_G014029 [Oculina patagonica]